MKKAISLAFAAICVSTTLSEAAAPRIDMAGIKKYVYPDNRAKSVPSASYMPDGETCLRVSDDKSQIISYVTATGAQDAVILDRSNTRENKMGPIDGFTISPDGSKLLVWCDSEPIYRRSSHASYYIFEIKRNILRPLSKQGGKQQSPVFSPDSRMVAFVVDNNIRVRKYDYDTEVDVTKDGAPGRIINGVPDWTYEEEFSTACSMAWAPDNSTLCYLKYNETDVPEYSLTLYEGYCDPDEAYALYPGRFTYKYPVAGQPNSRVTLHSYDVETRKIKDIPLTAPGIEYIPRIGFGDDATRLIVTTLNRDQNRMEVYSVNPRSTVSKSIIVEEARNGWLNHQAYEDMVLQDNGIVLMSERSGWNHLYRYSYAGQMVQQITSGDYDVTAYYGHDAAGNDYYQAEPQTGTPAQALNRVVCRRVQKTGRTETLTPAEGWASADFSPSLNYYTVNYSTADLPPVYTLYSSAKGKKVRVVEDNAAYAARYAGEPKKEFFTFESDGVTLNGYMIKPAGFDVSRRYPVIMWQYSGPGSQEVTNRWAMDWNIYAASKGFLVVCVDPRGTAGRGADFRNTVYRNLGHYETIDQINAARYVASLPYADGSRIGISGWSYGGYETLMCATAAQSPFAAAVAVAPVTSWRYYDTVYAERFMLTPQQNCEGYDRSAPVNRAASLACPLLIMYGTADDNVHPANSIEFVGRLQQAGLECDMFVFPAMNHSINGCDARAAVYGRMVNYFSSKLL